MRRADLNEFVKSAKEIEPSLGLHEGHCGSDSVVGKLGGTAAKVNPNRDSLYEIS